MSGNYTCGGFGNVGTNKTMINIIPGTGGRDYIYEILIGCSATPSAQAAYWVVNRTTAAGTGTAKTPGVIDPGEVNSRSTVAVNHSAEPTYSATEPIFSVSLNQQATIDWKANPGKELIIAASSTAGMAVKTLTATGTAQHEVTVMWTE